MRLYAIQAPSPPSSAPEKVRALRTGFSLAAFVFGPLWLLARGLWGPFALYAAAEIAAALAVRGGLLAPAAAAGLHAIGHLYIGLEGRGWLARPLADVVFANSALEAEKTFFERAFRGVPARGCPAPAAWSGPPRRRPRAC